MVSARAPLLALCLQTASGFLAPLAPLRHGTFLSAETPESFMTDYLAFAHEQKLLALRELEDAKNAEIGALKEEIRTLRESEASGVTETPSEEVVEASRATNCDLLQRLDGYRAFMSQYMVDAQDEKARAVGALEEENKGLEKRVDEYQKFVAEYVVRAQDEKMRAVRAAEEAIKSKLASDKRAEEDLREKNQVLAKKVEEYKKYMAEYMVKAQDEKFRAVKVAEETIKSKLALPLMPPPVEKPVEKVSSTELAPGSEVHQVRAKRHAEEIDKGYKGGRWGEMEMIKSISQAKTGAFLPEKLKDLSPKEPQEKYPDVVATPENIERIKEADHGMRADGGVGGLTLEERVLMGHNAPSSKPANGVMEHAPANGVMEHTMKGQKEEKSP